jgi:hypothetical protein
MSLFSNPQESFPSSEGDVDNKETEISIEVAEAEIAMIMQEVAVMGANDSEMGILKELQNKVRKQEVSPKEAVSQAVAIRESKQDYH